MRRIVFQAKIFIVGFAVLTAAATITPALAGPKPQPPCRNQEPAPPAGEPQVALRDATLAFDIPTPNQVTASMCLVIGKPAQPPNGVHLNYNFALLASDSELLDANGTVGNTGPFAAQTPDPFPQALSFYFPAPNGVDTRFILGEVSVAQCADPKCSQWDQGHGSYVTALLPPQVSNPPPGSTQPGHNPPGCLDPVNPQRDPELRQVTVAAVDTYYAIYACMVSSRYISFPLAQFQVEALLWGENNALDGHDGNTRVHIAPLVGAQTGGPKVLTLLAVDIPAKNGAPVRVQRANITTRYTGCRGPNETDCTSGSDPGQIYPVRFFTRSK